MMPELIPLDSQKHANFGWSPYTSLEFSGNDNCAPVVIDELSALMPHYGLAFLKRRFKGVDSCILVCLFSFKKGENLFLAKSGKWLIPYVPSTYRSYPFQLNLAKFEDEVKLVMMFDQASGLIGEMDDGNSAKQPLFQTNGELHPATARILDFMSKRHHSLKRTQVLVQQLAEKELLKPLTIPDSVSADKELLEELYQIDKKKLSELPESELGELTKSGALELAYAQLLSLPRMNMLAELEKFHASQQPSEDWKDKEYLFEDEVLSFDL